MILTLMLTATRLGTCKRVHRRSPQHVGGWENGIVTKKEIVKTISDEIGLTQLKTKEIVQKTFDAIVDTLVEDTKANLSKGGGGALGRIELRNFGVFEVKRRAARKARNPRTGEKVFVGEKFVVTFKPGKERWRSGFVIWKVHLSHRPVQPRPLRIHQASRNSLKVDKVDTGVE